MRTDSPKEHRFSTKAGDLCWFEWGTRSERPSLLLLHATGFHARCWDQVVAHLPEDLHIIAPDLPGHGRSFKPDTLADWSAGADDIIAILEETATTPAFVIGHSKGAVVAVHAATQRPDLVAQMLLVDPVILPSEAYWQGAEKPAIDPANHPVSRRRNQWESADQMAAHFAARSPYDTWQAAVLSDYCRHGLLPADDGNGYQLACPPHLEASVYLGAALSDPADACAAVPCPVTVLRGRSGARASPMDFSISPTWPALAAHFQHGTDMQWSDHSHFIPMEAPARLTALIEALAAS